MAAPGAHGVLTALHAAALGPCRVLTLQRVPAGEGQAGAEGEPDYSDIPNYDKV